jgi:hypothetical protein
MYITTADTCVYVTNVVHIDGLLKTPLEMKSKYPTDDI